MRACKLTALLPKLRSPWRGTSIDPAWALLAAELGIAVGSNIAQSLPVHPCRCLMLCNLKRHADSAAHASAVYAPRPFSEQHASQVRHSTDGSAHAYQPGTVKQGTDGDTVTSGATHITGPSPLASPPPVPSAAPRCCHAAVMLQRASIFAASLDTSPSAQHSSCTRPDAST